VILFAMLASAAICVNAVFATAGLAAAARYGIRVNLAQGPGLFVLVGSTVAELAALTWRGYDASTGLLVLAFGAVAAGAACDAASGYVFDVITLPCLGILLACAAITHAFVQVSLGATVAGGSLALLYALTRGRGLGLGDVKLACCIGAGAGVMGGIEALGIAFTLGGAYAAYVLLTKRGERGDEMRFAPYMAAGMALALAFGAAA
jgi:prepilin signal peptidase PulO-like enzyme (type II secretory pathway)